MDHKTEVELGILKLLDKYDAEALTFLVHFRGKISHLKFVFPDDDENACLSILSVLAKLSHDADVPALFLIPSRYKMVCGVWYADQLLIIVNASVEGEIVDSYKRIFKTLFSGSVGRPLKNLYIACTSPIKKELSTVWVEAVCIELIEKLEDMYPQIPEKFHHWSKLVSGYVKNNYEGFSYYGLPIGEVFENNTLLYLSRPGEVINYRTMREILERQKLSVLNLLRERNLSVMKIGCEVNLLNNRFLPAPKPSPVDFLKDYYYKAFWQIVVHRLLIDQIQLEVSSQKSARPLLLSPNYNPIPMSDIAYAQLLRLIREMSKIGSSEIDQLHAEVLQVEDMDYSSYDPSGSSKNRRFSSDDDSSDSWFVNDAGIGERGGKKKLNPLLSSSQEMASSLARELLVELAISYRFIGRNHWSDISQRRGIDNLLCGHNCCDCSEKSVVPEEHDIYLRAESPVTDDFKNKKSAGSPKPEVISSHVQFFVPQSTRREDKAGDLFILGVEMKAFLGERVSIASKLLSAARFLEKNYCLAYSKHRCAEYLTSYKWIFSLAGNADSIDDILFCFSFPLDEDLACCISKLEEVKELIDKNSNVCERLTKQKLLLESKDKITDAALTSTFPDHDLNTLRKILRDGELSDYFSTGVMELLVDQINIERAYQATLQFFSELQKIITFVKAVQLVFKSKLTNTSSSADLIKSELRDQIRAAIQPVLVDDVPKSSFQTTEIFSRW